MNVEKLHKLAYDIVEDDNEYDISGKFTSMMSQLNLMVTQPQPQHQNNFTTHLNSLYESLGESEMNSLSPAWVQVLIELGIDDLFGDKLKLKLQQILNTNTITPSNANVEFKTYRERHNACIGSFTNLVDSLETLQIGRDELSEGQCEIGILIPRQFIDNNLNKFEKEIGEINFILEHFSELITGDKKPFELRSLSTSEPLVTVATYVGIAAGISTVIATLISGYKGILEIRNIKNQAKEKGVSDANVKGLEKHCESVIKKEITKLRKELDKKYTVISDEGRKNEIMNSIEMCLKKLVNRIDNGFSFEVRMEEPEVEYDEDEEPIKSEDFLLYNEIQEASAKMEFLNTEGNPILFLNEDNPDTKTDVK